MATKSDEAPRHGHGRVDLLRPTLSEVPCGRVFARLGELSSELRLESSSESLRRALLIDLSGNVLCVVV